MTKTFIQTKEFSKNWDRLGFGDKDLRKLELELLRNASMYPVIKDWWIAEDKIFIRK